MIPKTAHMLSSSVLSAAPTPPARSPLIMRSASRPQDFEPDDHMLAELSDSSARRTRIWEFGINLHCSIIGTCLTTAALRNILQKLKTAGAETASDHDVHMLGVMLASRAEGGAKFLQKALDRQHQVAIKRYSRCKNPEKLLALWEESLKQGDIPGAYWAALTHPITNEGVVKRVFADVHMLSHLVGAANRADIRRLRELEQENASLAAKIERQQRQLQEGFATRDQTIRRLNEMLAARADEHPDRGNAGVADSVVRDLSTRLARQLGRCERMEQRARELSERLQAQERALHANRREHEGTRRELEIVEGYLASLASPKAVTEDTRLRLSGITMLYVGGRPHQIPQLRELAERAGAKFLHHDGGVEHSLGLLPGHISRADHVLFPIDCVSHEAVAAIKRVCRLTGKVYGPLRTASLACLLAGMAKLGERPQTVAAE
jgi:Uncharacterized protein conserved in bacteria (DUF2325)